MSVIYLPENIFVIQVNSKPVGFVYEEEKIEEVLNDYQAFYEMTAASTYKTHTYHAEDVYKKVICGQLRNDIFAYETVLYTIEAVEVSQL